MTSPVPEFSVAVMVLIYYSITHTPISAITIHNQNFMIIITILFIKPRKTLLQSALQIRNTVKIVKESRVTW